MDILYESVDKNQRTKERTETEDQSERAFRTRVLTENELHMHRAHAKQGTVSKQELSQVWPGGVTKREEMVSIVHENEDPTARCFREKSDSLLPPQSQDSLPKNFGLQKLW